MRMDLLLHWSGVRTSEQSLYFALSLLTERSRNHLLSADGQISESIRTPAVADWLQNVALRDLALQEQHAACIDANGDVYQWGDGFFGSPGSASPSSSKPVLTLRGKVRLYALCARAARVLSSVRLTYRMSHISRRLHTGYLLCRRPVGFTFWQPTKRSKSCLQASLLPPVTRGGGLAGCGARKRMSTL